MRLQWEYHAESLPMADLGLILDRMGEDGWELTFAQMGQLAVQSKVVSREQSGPIPALFVVMKRPKIEALSGSVVADCGAGDDTSHSVTIGLGLDVEAN